MIKINMISESEFTVQGHGVHTAYLELTRALQKRDDTDVAVNQSRPQSDIIHIQTVGLYALRKLLWGKGKKVVSAHIVPASFIGSLRGARYWLPLARWYLQRFYGRADLVLAVSGMVRTELLEGMHLSNRVETFYNTVDMAQYRTTTDDRRRAREHLHIGEDAFIILGNGQVQPRKRLDTFMAVARACPDMQFIWVGGIPFKQFGADYEKMQRLIKNVPSNVTVTGVIPLDQVKSYLQAADVFFLPAEQENHPMCVLEAAGAGLPIVLRDIHEYDDTFRPDTIFVSSDEAAVAAIKRLASDKIYYATYAQKSRHIAARFDSTAGAERAVALYRSLL